MSGTTAFIEGLTLTNEQGESRPVMVALSRNREGGLALMLGTDLTRTGLDEAEIRMTLPQLIELIQSNVTFGELAQAYGVKYKLLPR